MKLKINKKLIILLFCFILLFFTNVSYAGTQKWNSLNYDVMINVDGSANVVETWDVDISSTNTMFKTFEDDVDDYFEITDAKVSEIKNGQEVFLTEIYEEQYHVQSGCYYGLRKSIDEYEIAWNVGLDNSSDRRIYKIYYKINDVINQYEDCTEFYWQFLSTNNSMKGKNLTGKIILPFPVSDMEKLRVWGHGSLLAEIKKVNGQLIEFSLEEINSNEMVEVRIVTEENIYKDLKNVYNYPKLNSILGEEMRWADEANAEREKAKDEVAKYNRIIFVLVIVNFGILYIAISKAKKYKLVGQKLKEKFGGDTYNMDIEYFREIPNEENATPARAVYLRRYRKNSTNINSDLSEIFSATILNLSLKKILNFEVVSEKEIRIFISEDAHLHEDELKDDEKIILKLIKRASFGKEYITTKDFNKFASREYDYFYDRMHEIEKTVEMELLRDETMSRDKMKIIKTWESKQTLYIALGSISIMFCTILPMLFVAFLILIFAARKNATDVSVLTYEGQEEAMMWKGLKKYLNDYSMLDERLVPEIVIWEKYMVYATAFGIADKVLKQLKIVHPEMFDKNDMYYANNRYSYWNMINSPYYNDNMFNRFSKDLGNVYSRAASSYAAAHSSSSSGSGGGGGFSSGGGGGGGGGSCGGR